MNLGGPQIDEQDRIDTPERERERRVALSVVVPVTERPRDLDWIYETYSKELKERAEAFEFLFMLQPWAWSMAERLEELVEAREPIRIFKVGQTVGESVLLQLAADEADGDIIVTLPSYPRVSAGSLGKLIDEVAADRADLASAVRVAEQQSLINRLQNRLFHWMLGRSIGGRFRDVASGVRALKREVLEDTPLYGDFFRFLPVLAGRRGYRVEEIELPQHREDTGTRVYSPGIYLRRLIDLLGLFFLVRFTQKPLRFFGLLGSVVALAGAAILVVLLVQRLGGQGIADRPMLLLGAILVVLGSQAIALGLIGEIVVHLNASHSRLYRIRE